jgi:signal transduction histidine kinase
MDGEPRAQKKEEGTKHQPPHWLAAVAHDLRNPLAVIQYSADCLIRQGAAERRIIDDGLQRILRSVNVAERLVEELVDAATTERGIPDLQFTTVPAARLLAEAKTAGEALAAKASLVLEVQPAPDLPVRVDPDLIAQLFGNLIGNAVKFTPPGGRITLRALVADAEVHFSVADTGRGLSKEDRTRVFTAYWQRDANDERGRGLGLWICREIAEAHGGRIWIDPTDAGTTVVFALPRAEPNG